MSLDPFKPYLYGALAIIAVACAWKLTSVVQKAALYDQAQVELKTANDNLAVVVTDRNKLQEKFYVEQKERERLAKEAAEFERLYRSVAATGNSDAFNEQLCASVEGINGSRFGTETDPPGSACIGAVGGPPAFTLSEAAGANLLINLGRLMQYVQAVERVKREYSAPKN